jgi:ribonuclease H / adenosylcobalamin/alpha-ribazole phosphatase
VTKGVRKAGRTMKDAERRRLSRARRAAEADRPSDGTPAGAAMLWCDGGSRGNPGPAAFGYIVETTEGDPLASDAGPAGRVTAAVAEYTALVAGLEAVLELGVRVVEVRTDSRLVVAQMTGSAPVRSRSVAPLQARAADLATRIGTVTYHWIPAEQNGPADQLVAGVLGAGG